MSAWPTRSPVRVRTLVRPARPTISPSSPGTADAFPTGMRRGPGLDTSEGRSFVRDRLGLEGKMIFLLGGIFWLATTLLDSGLGIMKLADRLLWRPSVFHALGVLAMGLLWLVGRARPWGIRALGVFDAAGLLVS